MGEVKKSGHTIRRKDKQDMVDIDEIIEAGKWAELARHLLKTKFKNKSVEELRELEEKEVEKLCAPYDPALIVALLEKTERDAGHYVVF